MAEMLESSRKAVNGREGYLKREEEEEDELAFCMEKTVAFVVPMALKTLSELRVFDILAKGGKLCAKEIAVEIGSKNPEAPAMLDRLLSLLVSHSLLSCSISQQEQHPQKFYTLSPASKYFVTDPQGASLGSSVKLLLDDIFLKSWGELKGAILEGGVAFDRAHGMHAFEYPRVDPRFNEVFNNGMIGLTTIIMKRILELYNGFEHVTRLVDVGGGYGVNLKLIKSKYPHIQAINFDLPHVVENAPLHSGVEHVGGDMFESVPSGDAILVKSICHNWGDEDCIKFLRNCHKALPPHGKVIVLDYIIPEVPNSSDASKHSTIVDNHMLLAHGGRERTETEFENLCKSSGFFKFRVACNDISATVGVMEFYK